MINHICSEYVSSQYRCNDDAYVWILRNTKRFHGRATFRYGDYMQTSLVIQQTAAQSRITNTTAIRAIGPVSRVNL